MVHMIFVHQQYHQLCIWNQADGILSKGPRFLCRSNMLALMSLENEWLEPKNPLKSGKSSSKPSTSSTSMNLGFQPFCFPKIPIDPRIGIATPPGWRRWCLRDRTVARKWIQHVFREEYPFLWYECFSGQLPYYSCKGKHPRLVGTHFPMPWLE